MSEIEVRLDRDRCVYAWECVTRAPAVFNQADDGELVMLTDRPAQFWHEHVREAALWCPNGAITILEHGSSDRHHA